MGYVKECVGCGNTFETEHFQRRRCRKDCGRAEPHRARACERAAHDVDFIAVDGEGVTLADGSHHYVLISVGDESYHRGGRPLHHDEIFEFLYDHFERNPNATYVGFFLGYDFTQWVRTLTENRAAMLLSPQGIAARQPKSPHIRQPFMVDVEHTWEIDVLAGKRFKLRPASPRGQKPQPTMYICDAGPFFQTSLLNVLDPDAWPEQDYPISKTDLALILEGKARRATAAFDHAMVRYNVAENRALTAVMGHLNAGLVSAGVRLRKDQWFGPGQAAAAWLAEHCDHTGEAVREAVPAAVLEAGIAAYYGGWFEIFAHGHVPGVSYEYDINSAYPAAIAQLPCLLHGSWEQGGSGKWCLENATLVALQPIIGAAPYRNSDGAISRPKQVTGWLWKHEIDALTKSGLCRRLKTHERWVYRPCACRAPMTSVRELYMQRIALGEKGKNSPQGKAYKLLYNSMYGKFAQSIGSPRFANPLWASLITSLCRTKIVTAIASHPTGIDDLIMIATDAVFFRTPNTSLELSSTELGAWSLTERRNLCVMMPGVYWDDKTRQRLRDGQSPKLKSRGVAASALAACVEQMDEAFADFDPLAAPVVAWPGMRIPLSFAMVTATQAVARHRWETAGTLTPDASRNLSSDPKVKRDPTSVWRDRGVWRTRWHGFAGASIPYDRRFGLDMERERMEVPWSQDGDIAMIIRDGFDW